MDTCSAKPWIHYQNVKVYPNPRVLYTVYRVFYTDKPGK